MPTFFFGFCAFWILMGFVRLRRAYVGERKGLLVTLNPSSDRLMSRRERVMSMSLGMMSLIVGVAYFWLGLRHIR